MILTNCAACAAPLANDAPRCVRCKERYCNSTCQHDHWRRSHKQMCKKIHRGGNAEQYNADKKYKEAVAVAVEACAADTKGQTCFICTQALHWKTKEGLVRGCACRGTAGFAHVSCLVEQAKILVAEADENNLGANAFNERWLRWKCCSLCEQRYHGVVQSALGWGCWKTYASRPLEDVLRRHLAAMHAADALFEMGRHDEALAIREGLLRNPGLEMNQRVRTMSSMSSEMFCIGRMDEGIALKRKVYEVIARTAASDSWWRGEALQTAVHLATMLAGAERYGEAADLMRERIPEARAWLGDKHETTLMLRETYCSNIVWDPNASANALRECEGLLEVLCREQRQIFGASHPSQEVTQQMLGCAQARLAGKSFVLMLPGKRKVIPPPRK